MATVDKVEFNGITFRRYPESDNRPDRCYYRPSGDLIEEGVEALHREIWRHHNGEIPEGHLIHHKDGDSTNNDIDNLECLSPKEHAERHPEWGNQTDEHLERIVELAKEWHKSEKGREWHRKHWHESLAKAFDETHKECDQCGGDFIDNSVQDAGRFCSNACKAKWRRDSGVDDEERICEACLEPFSVNKYSDRRSCSRRCGGALISWARRI